MSPRFRTKKRRTTHPFSWWIKKDGSKHGSFLEPKTQSFVDEMAKNKFGIRAVNEDEIYDQRKEWTLGSRRCGLIGKKIGIQPYWKKDGSYGLATLLWVPDNHVIKSYNVEETKKNVIHQERWRSDGLGCMIVGAESGDPQNFSAAYCGIFAEAGVLPKKKMTRMFVSEDGLLMPGTGLDVSHFRVGDYVDVFGKTIDHGFQGVMIRWMFRGMPKLGTTKAHRRPGSLAFGRKAAGPKKGKKLPGHMGSERKTHNGTQILRIDYEKQVIYVKGPSIPGEINSWCYIFDSKIFGKRPSEANPPPFPTSFPGEKEGEKEREKESGIVYHESIHPPDAPTIMFKEDPKEKKIEKRTGAKLAKIRAK